MLTLCTEVGFGLELCCNAAPLLLIELSYPTQVLLQYGGSQDKELNKTLTAREDNINVQSKLVSWQHYLSLGNLLIPLLSRYRLLPTLRSAMVQ